MGLFDFILGTAFLGNVVHEAKSISDVQNSSEYQETVKLSTEEIQEYDDYRLMKEFHENYTENSGRGLLTNALNHNYLYDPVYKAFNQVFKERRYYRDSIICTHCGTTAGFRWKAPDTVDYSLFKDDIVIVGGTEQNLWTCPDCKQSGYWKYLVSKNGRHYYKPSSTPHWEEL